jgi:hypothetical protein
MKKALYILAIVIAIPFLISQKPPRNGSKSYVDGQIMVKFRSDVSRAEKDYNLQVLLHNFRGIDMKMEEKLSDRFDIVLMDFTPGRLSDEEVLQQVKASPGVEMAQFNHYIESRDLIPSDQYFDLQWNMHNTGQTGGTADADIDGPEGWGLGTNGVTATGDTIVIAIVDDGFDLTHEDLKFWKNWQDIPGNNIDDDGNGYIDDYDGWNAWTNSPNIVEKDHGTHVTGIACAQGDNDKGVTGVSLHVKALPVVGSATVESIVVIAYTYVYEMRHLYNETNGAKGAFIVATNSSFGVNNGLPEDYPIWGAMYDSMGTVGILSAAATANANWDIDEVSDIPTAFPSDWLISVTNTDPEDHLNPSAAYGDTTIDLGAPGTSIYSTRMDGQYGYKTGCSMASPHVAGAVGYLFGIADEAFMQAYHDNPAVMALNIKQAILQGVDTLPSLTGKTVSNGRLNIYKAAQILPFVGFRANIVASAYSVCSGESVELSAQVFGGGSGSHTFSWSSDPTGFSSTDSVVTVSPVVTTTYTVEVTDQTGMTTGDASEITIKPLPGKPVISNGPATVDNFTTTTSGYTCSAVSDADSYQWSVSPAEAGTVGGTGTEGSILWANDFTGTATITVAGVNGCGEGEFSEAFTTVVYSSQGIDENAANQVFRIWPNPTRAILNFEFLILNAGKDHLIDIFNAEGKQIRTYQLPKDQSGLIINLDSFEKGSYFLMLKEGNNVIGTKRFIKID